MKKKPETLDEYEDKIREMFSLLVEARDTLPAISLVSARLNNVSLTLANRIEEALEPWRITDEET